MENNYKERRAPMPANRGGRKYEVEYIHNGFWLGGFKKAKIEATINNRVSKGWQYVGMQSHNSVFLLLFRRTSVILMFCKDY